jgi:hypothetical protein
VTRQAFFVGLFALVVVGCGSADDGRPAVWSYIHPVIIAPNCATVSCHSKTAAVAGLDLSTPDEAYRGLTKLMIEIKTDPSKPESFPRPLVNPGYPDSSRIVTMMRALDTPRMPPDRPLAKSDVDLVARWILLGANQD